MRVMVQRFSLGLGWFAALCLLSLTGCGSTPQITADEDCMAATDALYTAVSAKRPPLLEQSAAEIEKLHTAGRLPDDAFERLSSVITQARAGQWVESRVALKKFIQGQRPAPKA